MKKIIGKVIKVAKAKRQKRKEADKAIWSV